MNLLAILLVVGLLVFFVFGAIADHRAKKDD